MIGCGCISLLIHVPSLHALPAVCGRSKWKTAINRSRFRNILIKFENENIDIKVWLVWFGRFAGWFRSLVHSFSQLVSQPLQTLQQAYYLSNIFLFNIFHSCSFQNMISNTQLIINGREMSEFSECIRPRCTRFVRAALNRVERYVNALICVSFDYAQHSANSLAGSDGGNRCLQHFCMLWLRTNRPRP